MVHCCRCADNEDDVTRRAGTIEAACRVLEAETRKSDEIVAGAEAYLLAVFAAAKRSVEIPQLPRL